MNNKQVARLTNPEKRMLVELAEIHHLSQNTMLRVLIVKAHREMTKNETREPEMVSL